MANQLTSEDPLRCLVRALQETTPPRALVGNYSWIPRFLCPPPVEMTKSIVNGVDCDEVYPSIFIGDEGSARNKEFLNAVGITHVFNTAEGASFGQVSTGSAYYTGTGMAYLGLNLMDLPQTRIIKFFEQGSNFIDSALSSNGKVLVHCLMGLSRSSTFVIAYLMMKKGMKAEEAIRTIRRQRNVRPNDGFLVQLLQQEKTLFANK